MYCCNCKSFVCNLHLKFAHLFRVHNWYATTDIALNCEELTVRDYAKNVGMMHALRVNAWIQTRHNLPSSGRIRTVDGVLQPRRREVSARRGAEQKRIADPSMRDDASPWMWDKTSLMPGGAIRGMERVSRKEKKGRTRITRKREREREKKGEKGRRYWMLRKVKLKTVDPKGRWRLSQIHINCRIVGRPCRIPIRDDARYILKKKHRQRSMWLPVVIVIIDIVYTRFLDHSQSYIYKSVELRYSDITIFFLCDIKI